MIAIRSMGLSAVGNVTRIGRGYSGIPSLLQTPLQDDLRRQFQAHWTRERCAHLEAASVCVTRRRVLCQAAAFRLAPPPSSPPVAVPADRGVRTSFVRGTARYTRRCWNAVSAMYPGDFRNPSSGSHAAHSRAPVRYLFSMVRLFLTAVTPGTACVA